MRRGAFSHKAGVCLFVRSGKDSSPSIYIYLICGKQSIWRNESFKDKNLLKSMWSFLRFKWQFSESQTVFFALSLTMIIVIEQNVVFSTEVYEYRHLRLYFQSSMYRLSHVSLLILMVSCKVQGSAFARWFESIPYHINASILQHHQLITPFFYDFFSINFIPEWSYLIFFLKKIWLLILVLAFSVFIKWLDLFGWRVG